MRLPSSLTSRLVLIAVGLVLLVTVLISAVTTVAMRGYLYDRLDAQVSKSMDRLVHGPPGGGGALFGPTLGTEVGTVTGLFPSNRDAEGFVISTGTNHRAYRQTVSAAVLSQLEEVPADGSVHGVQLPALGSYRVEARQVPGGEIITGLPTTDVDDTLASLVWWEVLLGLVGVVAAAGAGTVVVRRQLRPLTEVAGTAQAVTALPLATVVEVRERVPDRLTDERSEVGRVGAALNRLLSHVEVSLAARDRSEHRVRQFVADASHELRTPLSTIRGYAELSRRTPEDAAALSNVLAKVEVETGRMSGLVEDLLLLARLDSGRPLERGEVDVTYLLLESVSDARVIAPDHRWQLRLPDVPLTITGDEQRLRQVVTNLLGNARHHTPLGTTVVVAADLADGHVDITVHDDGPGLSPGMVDHAFERFTRGDSSRTRASGGAGLGLSMVAAIAQAHGGSARLSSEPGDTTFTITLPA